MVSQQLSNETRLEGVRKPVGTVGVNKMSSTGLSISREFIESTLIPLLKKSLPSDFDRLAVAIVGTGSEILGMDDEISRDHHWGPRANVMYLRADADRLRDKLRTLFDEELPRSYGEYAVHANIGNLTGVCCGAVEDFFLRFLGIDQLPVHDLDWLVLCEVDLFHVTAGEVVCDGPGELTRRHRAGILPGKRLAETNCRLVHVCHRSRCAL